MYEANTMDESDIEGLFQNACSYVKATAGTLKSDDLLFFYALYKQVSRGVSIEFYRTVDVGVARDLSVCAISHV